MEGIDEPVPDLENGFLTKQMREYLRDPAKFEADHDSDAVDDIRYRIREARKDAIDEIRFLDTRQDDWIREQPAANTYPDSEPRLETASLHAPLPVPLTTDIPLHDDTVEALKQVRDRLNQVVIDFLIKEVDDLPPEYSSKQEFREYLMEKAMEVRSASDGKEMKQYERFWGDNFLTFDDIIRLGLMMFPNEEVLRGMDLDEFAALPGTKYKERVKILRTYGEALDKSYLKR